VPLKTNDLIFLAMDSPDFAVRPSDPMRPGVRLDYSEPIQSPWMRGVGQSLASANPSTRPTSMVELQKLWREERNLMANDAYDAMLEAAAQQRAAVEAAAALAPFVGADVLKTILEEIEACQRQ
jgi:hypothetical protein